MGFRIPEEKITEVKNAADIVDIIADAVVLKKAGKNFLGLCPFHSEKTPSFSVSPDKQIFHCFGCGTGGNVFTFLMKHQGLSFPDAVKAVANRYGIALPRAELSPGQRREMSQREALHKLNAMASRFYRDCLESDRTGRQAAAYLRDRGFDKDAIDRFGIGYAPGAWDGLARLFQSKRVPTEMAAMSGLVVPRKTVPGTTTGFGDRVMFPIFDGADRIIGFGGRVIGDGQPKYLNSPETPIYNKRKSLYGINWARASCRQLRRVFIVEGYLDLLSLNMSGIQNVVATLGTALTAEQIRALKGIVGNGTITLVFDSDNAGLKAAHRSLDLFWREHTDFKKGDVFTEADADTRILVLPTGHDPDSFVKDYGADAFLEAAENAPGVIPFLCESAIGRFGLSAEGKIRVMTELAAALAGINDPVARSVYIRMIADRLGIDEGAVIERVRSEKKRQGRAGRPRSDDGTFSPPPSTAGGVPSTPLHGTNRLERLLVAMMLQYPAINENLRQRRIVDRMEDPVLKMAGTAVLAERRSDGVDVAALIQRQTDGQVAAVLSELAMTDEEWNEDGCLRLIHQFEMKRRRTSDDLVEKIRKAESENDQVMLLQLLREKQRLARRARTATGGHKHKARQ